MKLESNNKIFQPQILLRQGYGGHVDGMHPKGHKDADKERDSWICILGDTATCEQSKMCAEHLGLLQPAVALGNAALLRAWRDWHEEMPDETLASPARSRLHCGKRQQASAVQGLRREPRPNTRLFLAVSVMLLAAPVASAYYDDTVGDRELAYGFLDDVEAEVGHEAFAATPEALTLRLALTLGKLDKEHLTPAAFIRHVQHAGKAGERFYKGRKLSTDEVAAYLLPYRIRYEHTSKPLWLTTLAEHFAPITEKATTADEAAGAVLAWIPAHVKLFEPALSYPLPIRGDLDPLTVLKGGYGSEVDCAIFGVAALRSCGVAARFVWAPALRGGVGGKAWLEYLGETGQWIPWVPSFGDAPDHAAEIRKRIGASIVCVMARPEEPVEITGSYVETMRVEILARQENVVVQLMVAGSERLLAAHGNEIIGSGLGYNVGKGALIVAATFSNRSFALLPVECPPGGNAVFVVAEAGKLSIREPENPAGQKSETNR